MANRIMAAWMIYGWMGYIFEAVGLFVSGNIYDQVWSLQDGGPKIFWGFFVLFFVTLTWVYEFIKPKTEFKLNIQMIPISVVLVVVGFIYPGTPPVLHEPFYGPCDTTLIYLSMAIILLFIPSVTALLGTLFYAASFLFYDLFAMFTGLSPTWCEVFGHGAMSPSRFIDGGAPGWVYADYLAWSVAIIAGSYFIYRYLKKNNLGVIWIFKTYWLLFAASLIIAFVVVIVE